MEGCVEKKLTLEYPKHLCSPEDLLHFIEATQFTEAWDKLGLDLEDDLTSLQMCIMSNPEGDCLIKNSGGLRKHHHIFGDWSSAKGDITAYYAYFESYGIAYLVYFDEESSDLDFDKKQLSKIRKSIKEVEREIERLQVIG